MKRHGLFLFGVALLLSITCAHAVEGIKLAVQGSNAIVTWPSTAGEAYIVQHRATLHSDTPWVTVAANLSAALNTNQTSFVHTEAVVYPGCTNSGGGTAEGPPPSPSGTSSSSSSAYQYEGREPYTWEKENRPPFPWDPEMEERRKASKSDSLMDASTQSLAPECQPTMGFYRVVRNGIHLFGITNGMNLSGKVGIAVEVGSDLGTLQTVTLSANDQDILGTQPLSSPFTSPYLYFDVDTASLNNGAQTLQARATFLVPQTNTFDSPWVSVSSVPVTVSISNEIFYPNWVTEFSDDLLIVTVSTAHLNSSWEVDVYGSADDYIGTFSGTTTDGLIDFAWNLLDPQGLKRNDETFYTVTTVTPAAGSPPAPAAAPVTKPNPPSRRQVDNYPDEGMWTVVRQDYIPHHYLNYELYNDAVNSIAGMAEQRGGVLPLPDGTHRNFGEAMLLKTNADWTFWIFNANGVTNRNVRNLYYDGHGAPDALGDNTGSIGAALLGHFLGNSTTQPVGQTRYRFVWLDGCETASGIWPYAFAMGKQENKPLSSYAARPGAFCGFTQRTSVHAAGTDGSGVVNQSGAFYRSEFVFHWHLRDRTVKQAFQDAQFSSGWTGATWLKIYGYWGLRAGEFNRKSQWP